MAAGDKPDLELFEARLTANRVKVFSFTSPASAGEWVKAEFKDQAGAAVDPLVPAELRPQLTPLPAESAPLGVSLASGAVAELGTLLFSGQASRRISLLVPWHLVWIRSDTVFPDLAAALAALPDSSATGLHSGPSRSSDIGQMTIFGMHGPGQLWVGIVP
jgi:L-lactate dehydrogenase complex protein LldG